MNVAKEIEIYDKEKTKELLYKEFKKNKKIADEISMKNKKLNLLNTQIKVLQEKLSRVGFEMEILEEIKNSQKTLLTIEDRLVAFTEGLRSQNILNNWIQTVNLDGESAMVRMFTTKNLTYNAAIIVNYNKKRNFYRVDFELTLSSILLDMAKEYKRMFETSNDIKIVHEGRILYSETESEEFIKNLKNKYKNYFIKEKPPILEKFKDVENKKYTAQDFIVYDDMTIDGFETIENIILENSDDLSDEIPF